jgi:hypothetical protein
VVCFYDQREHGMLFLQRLKRGISGSNGMAMATEMVTAAAMATKMAGDQSCRLAKELGR